MKKTGLPALLLMGSVVTAPLFAAAPQPQTLNEQNLHSTRMTLYPGQAWIEQSYGVDLTKGDHRIAIKPVSDQLLFETLQIRSENGQADQIQLQRQPLNNENFYRGLLGQPVLLYQNGDMQAPAHKAVLSDWQGSIGIATLENGSQRMVDLHDPNGLRVATRDEHFAERSFLPQLSARLRQAKSGDGLSLRYFSRGIGYHLQYQLHVDHKRQRISGRAVSVLTNQTNTDYPGVKLVLASGDTGAGQSRMPKRMMMAESAMADGGGSAAPEAIGELKFYPVEQPLDLPAYSEQQFTLLSFNDLKYTDHYQLDVMGMRAPGRAEHPRKMYQFTADRNLPAGELRMFDKDAKGQLQWILSGQLESRGEQQSVLLRAAEASDILIEREMVQQQRLDRNLGQVEWRLKLFNSKADAVWLHVQHRDHNLRALIVGKDAEQPTANLIRFKMPPGESELRYTVNYQQ
ncbi:DUF4140 domain-containing protein [Aestuariirhabdus haliotis]|uniref:DUF4140 domain-containing protein n=1 Tax=Aestuariirhabdus haliotis TaxID=2918751 RepID=UPI0020BE424C|nr:DUF4140 domain-containing protein [Aestuariirhabdus haliotis]MCL6420602.1 DUF4140 domain-containing protein [Aestuariirhabdus haliotis]